MPQLAPNQSEPNQGYDHDHSATEQNGGQDRCCAPRMLLIAPRQIVGALQPDCLNGNEFLSALLRYCLFGSPRL